MTVRIADPVTEAGNELLDEMGWADTEHRFAVHGLILRIEAEAAARQVTELRAAVERIATLETALNGVGLSRHVIANHDGEYADCQRAGCDGVRALLSAGDKAEAPR